MTTLTLIDRVEAATEGSRELSDEMLLALGWTKHETKTTRYREPNWGEKTDASGKVSYEHIEPPVWWAPGALHGSSERPNITVNTDDARSLYPEGCRAILQDGAAYKDGIYMAPCGCDLHSPVSSSGGPNWEGFANTLPCAITAALLRLREG